MYSFEDFVIDYMDTQGLSQREFAAKINVSNTTVSNWLKGKSRPDLKQLLSIANLTGESIEALAMLIEPTLVPHKSISAPAMIFARRYDRLPESVRERIETIIREEGGVSVSQSNDKPQT